MSIAGCDRFAQPPTVRDHDRSSSPGGDRGAVTRGRAVTRERSRSRSLHLWPRLSRMCAMNCSSPLWRRSVRAGRSPGRCTRRSARRPVTGPSRATTRRSRAVRPSPRPWSGEGEDAPEQRAASDGGEPPGARAGGVRAGREGGARERLRRGAGDSGGGYPDVGGRARTFPGPTLQAAGGAAPLAIVGCRGRDGVAVHPWGGLVVAGSEGHDCAHEVLAQRPLRPRRLVRRAVARPRHRLVRRARPRPAVAAPGGRRVGRDGQ